MRLALATPTLLSLFALALALTGCPDDEGDGARDSGPDPSDAADTTPDSSEPPPDSGMPPDGGDAPDSGEPQDAGEMPAVTLFPGTGVLVGGSMINVGTDTFADVNTKLAAAQRTRSPQDASRSYEYAVGSTTITIWYANSNLDGDDQLPNDVDDTDAVLWIAVEDGFPGTTAEGIGLDSTRTELEAAYGAPPHTVDVPNPAGTLAQYYVRGLLVAYQPSGDIRTMTIARTYETEPNGTIDLAAGTVTFDAATLMARGASPDMVTALLGEPDGIGVVMLGAVSFDARSYGFLGLEVFFGRATGNTFFLTLHPPFYGTTSGGLGMGSSRADMETHLVTDLGYTASASSNPQLICYQRQNSRIGVTYTMTDERVSSITLALPSCP